MLVLAAAALAGVIFAWGVIGRRRTPDYGVAEDLHVVGLTIRLVPRPISVKRLAMRHGTPHNHCP